jgi:hypothetical protein
MIERVRTRGERLDRFVVRPHAWDEYMLREDQFEAPRRVLRVGLTLREECLAHRGRGAARGGKRGEL